MHNLLYTGSVSRLIDTLAAELERPRPLSPKVVNYISTAYGIDYDAIGSFLVDKLPELEDDELDLVLSPVFTPKLADQAVFAELLGGDSVPRDEWPALIEKLIARPTRAQLITPDSRTHSVGLRDVALERYVHRLRLDATIPEPLLNLIEQAPPAADRPMLKAVARRAVWEHKGRAGILSRYLANALARNSYRVGDAIALLDLMESYKPVDLAELLAWIPRRQKALEEQINVAAGPKPFFSSAVQEMHGYERDQRTHDEQRLSAKQDERAFLERLLEVIR
jgi:hypothetical protein